MTTSKRSRILHLALLGLALAPGCTEDAATGRGSSEHTTGAGARVVRATAGALTAPSTAPPAVIATDFVSRQAAVGADQLVVAAQVPGRGGVTHVRLTQTLDGLRVEGAYARVAISSQGEVLQSIDRLAPATGAMVAASISERDALVAALGHLGYDVPALVAGPARGHTREFAAGADFYRNPSVERVAYLAADGSLRIGFQVATWSQVGNRLDYTLVDGAGAIVAVEHRTNTDRYNVFVEDPLKGPQTVVAGPGAGNAESPSGWLAGSQTTINITGNNARAYLDTDANNAPDSGGSAVATGDFLTAADLTAPPSTTGNKAVAAQNLFYLNNVVHDVLYRHGFKEAAGNFQVNNFGLGGLGNDPVQAEAQDGSGTDNANFSTPNDGSAPRMQMFLWSGSGPNALVTVNGADYGAQGSTFGPALTLTGVTGPLGIMTPADGCTSATAPLTGKVAIVDRGSCNFTVKVMNAQRAGAVAVIISNNAPGNATAPGGTERKVRIPSAMVTQADGVTLRGLTGASSRLRKNPTAPTMIDGDLDADIVFHEYGHGLTWRMIGSMSGKLAGAVGEGASDVNAFLLDGDDRIGEYSASSPGGIRRYPYASHPLTYSAVDGGGVHNDGEIYARAMWRVMDNYAAAGLGATELHGDFVDGMNFTPASPAFEDMRDGMLQSVAGTGRECLVWRGFAASGIGVGADGRVSPSGTVTIVESFAVPAACQ